MFQGHHEVLDNAERPAVAADADHDQTTNGFGSKILKVFKLSGYLQ